MDTPETLDPAAERPEIHRTVPPADLDVIATGGREVAALRGWRREVFGSEAIDLCEGRLALAAKGAKVITLPI